ncbi:MAG: S8 family serine peptidase [bacterium]
MKRLRYLLIAVVMVSLTLTFLCDATEKIHATLLGPGELYCPNDSADVWIFFRDRGFKDNSALRQALEKAAKSLLPANRQRREKVRSLFLVDERDLSVCPRYCEQVQRCGARLRTQSRYLNAISARIPRTALFPIAALECVKEIRPLAKGRRIEPPPNWNLPHDPIRQPANTCDLNYGPSFAQLYQINAVAAHDSGFSGAGVLVCLLDTGFFTDHEALVNQPVIAERDFINNDPETQNEPGDSTFQHDHGTFTFSALGGAHEGDLYGPAYGATFILGKTESVSFEQPIEEDWYVAGLEWADSLGAQVVSTSLGYIDWYTFADLDGNTAVTTIGVDIAIANGIVVVTAAGNERESSWGHIIAPADADSVISVGAVNASGEIASFSSPGPTYDDRIKPEVCARGVNTWCATPWSGTTGYYGIGGTSLATPLVGGACALILEAHPEWTPIRVRMALMATASRSANPDNDYGWGIINVMAAIRFNSPPRIVQRYPEGGSPIVQQDSLQGFWVQVEDLEGDSLLYHWWVDSTQVYFGPDSFFNYIWVEAETSVVKVVVEDSQMNTDSSLWTVQVEGSSGVSSKGYSASQSEFALYPAFPNPFNATTTVQFNLLTPGAVALSLYNVSGQKAADLIQSQLPAGLHYAVFSRENLPSGLYFLKLSVAENQQIQKVILVK